MACSRSPVVTGPPKQTSGFFCSFQIASSLTKELCALVFGINTFFGTILKSVIILIFADKRGLALDVHSQVRQVWQ